MLNEDQESRAGTHRRNCLRIRSYPKSRRYFTPESEKAVRVWTRGDISLIAMAGFRDLLFDYQSREPIDN